MGVRNALTPAVFFDRDGVLNEAIVRNGRPFPPTGIGELRLVSNAAEAVRTVHEMGFLAIVVTNQPDVARGTQSLETVDRLNAAVARGAGVDALYACYHDDSDGCDCRKPAPGLFYRARDERDIDLGRSYMVGDRAKDIAAGEAAGCRTVFIDCGYTETTGPTGAAATASSLREAIAYIRDRERTTQP